jgi:hypothetical protein
MLRSKALKDAVKAKIRECNEKNLIGLTEWHISRVMGGFLSYVEINGYYGNVEPIEKELQVNYYPDSEEYAIELYFRGCSVHFNRKGTGTGSLSAI